jgi:phosphoribosyl 1,2-cyclic phosphate phosphodiesterase
MLELTFLGTGTSNGVPRIGCHCPVCESTDPRDKRNRTSAVVCDGERTVLIDTSPELRLQAIAAGLDRIDAVLFTHHHADHTAGLDDLRRFNEIAERHLPVYANAETAESLRERFAYAFVDAFPFYGGKPDLILHEIDGPFDLLGREIVPVPVWHGRLRVFGYRIGRLGYITDAKTVPESSIALLAGVDTLVINALRTTPHPTHLSVQEAIDIVQEIRPRQAYLIHLSHDLTHTELEALLPPGIAIAYDGLRIAVEP